VVTETLWKEFLSILSAEVGSRVVETWFRSITLVRWDSQAKIVYLKAPNHFIRDWVSTHYQNLFQTHLGRLLNEHSIKIVFVNDGIGVEAMPEYHEHYGTPENGSHHHESMDSIKIKPARTSFPHQAPPSLSHQHLFETFVVGPSNALAFAAAHAVTQNPGALYNPLLIWGGDGLGKTHLLQAIGNRIKQMHKQAQILYQTADRFISDFIMAARTSRIQQFEARYRQVDVLLLDDIQCMSNKHGTQDMFYQIFTNLHLARKQVVCTCDNLPRAIPGLSDRIRSRLEGGLITDLQAAPLETRLAILRTKAQAHNVVLSDDVVECIATRVPSNIRDLEGALIRVMAYASLTRQNVTLDLVSRVIENALPATPRRSVELQNILKHVSKSFDYSVAEIKSPKRSKDLAQARHIAIYLMKKMTDRSLREIAHFMDRQDHSTILHAVNKLEAQAMKDPSFGLLINRLERELLN
jgi:chromosomal replication initiator protein